MTCSATYRGVQCLWKSDRPHAEHRAFFRHDGGIFNGFWTDDAQYREVRIVNVYSVDGRQLYVDPAGREN